MFLKYLLLSFCLCLTFTLKAQTDGILCTDTESILLPTIVSNELEVESWLVVNELASEVESDKWTNGVYQNDSIHPFQTAQKTTLKTPNQTAYLASPLFVPNNNTVLRFEYSICLENQTALTSLQGGNVFEVRVLTNCENETMVWQVNAQNEVVIVDLNQWQNDSIRVAFFVGNNEIENSVSLDVFVDNVFIGETPIVDVGFVYPQAFFDRPCLPDGIPFEIAVANYGTSEVLLSETDYDLNGTVAGIPFADFDETTLGINDTVLLSLSEVPDLNNVLFEIELSSNNDLPFNNIFSKIFESLPTVNAPILIDFDDNFQVNYFYDFNIESLGFFGNDSNSENALSVNLANSLSQKITTAPIFIESNTQLIFDLSINDYFNQNPSWFDLNESLTILISNDCGYTQQVLVSYDATNSVFEADSILLTDYIGETVVVAFLSNANKDIFIDNINFSTTLDNDLSLTALESPSPYLSCFGSNEKIVVGLSNVGVENVVVAEDVLLGGTILYPDSTLVTFAESLIGNDLAAGESGVFETVNVFDFSQYGNYEVTVFLSWSVDGNQLNDTLETITFIHQSPDYNLTFPLTFENYNGNNLTEIEPKWVEAEGVLDLGFVPDYEEENSQWAADFFGNNPAHENGTAAAINLWQNNKQSWIIGPRFEVVDTTQLIYDLALTQFANTDAATLGSDDTFAVMVSTDCGASFEILHSYNSDSVISPIGQTDTLSLLDYSGQEISIAFYASEGTIEDTVDVLLFLDNIRVIGLFIPPGDVGISDVVNPSIEFCETTQLSLVVRNQNFNDRLQGDFITTAIVSGAIDTILHDTISNPIDPLGGRFSIFQLQNVFGDSLHITAFTNLEGDTNPSNDTIQTTVTINSPPDVSLEIDSIGCDSLVIVPLVTDPVTQFDWSTGDTTKNLTVFDEGEYVLRTSYKGCFVRDTINVTLLPAMITDFSWSLEDSILFLEDLSINTDTVSWQINDTTFLSQTIPQTYVLPDTGVYFVSLLAFSENCGSDTLTQTVIYEIETEMDTVIDGTMSLPIEYMMLYPNPADDKLQISFQPSKDQTKQIHLFDLLGKHLSTIETTESYLTIPTNNLPTANYYLIIQENGVNRSFIFTVSHP